MANALLPSSPAAAPARRRPRLLVVGHHPHRVAIVLVSLLLLQLVDASSIRRPGTSASRLRHRPDLIIRTGCCRRTAVRIASRR